MHHRTKQQCCLTTHEHQHGHRPYRCPSFLLRSPAAHDSTLKTPLPSWIASEPSMMRPCKKLRCNSLDSILVSHKTLLAHQISHAKLVNWAQLPDQHNQQQKQVGTQPKDSKFHQQFPVTYHNLPRILKPGQLTTSSNMSTKILRKFSLNLTLQAKTSHPSNTNRSIAHHHGASCFTLKQIGIKSTHQKNGRATSLSDFEVICELGSGKTATVQLARVKANNFLVALKVMPKQLIKEQKLVEYVAREIKLHSSCSNQNIIRLYSHFQDGQNIYLVLQYMGERANLYTTWRHRKPLPELQASSIVADVCRAVAYLHSHNIMHRDIKMENVIYAHGVAKLMDLGCAAQTTSMRSSQVGSPAYLSPQQLQHRPYDQKIDVWGVGVLAYELLFGYSPFNQQIQHHLHHQSERLTLQLCFPPEPAVSAVAQDFVSQLLSQTPSTRPDMHSALAHPFLTGRAGIR